MLKSTQALVSIAESLKKLVSLLEVNSQGSSTGLRTNYSDNKPDASYFSEVDDTTEFLRDLEEAARVAQGLPPKIETDADNG